MISFPVMKKIKTSSNLRVELVRSIDGLDEYADAWDMLALNAPQQHPVMTHAWISAYLKTKIPASDPWFCLFAFYGTELVGVLPLVVREYQFLGKKYLSLNTPNHPHTRWVDFLFKEKFGKRVIQLFADYLNAMRPRVVRLTMDQVICNSQTFGILEEGIDDIYSYKFPNGYESIIPVDGSYSDYRKGLSKKMTSNMRRSYNLLKKLGDFSITVINDAANSQKDLLSFAAIEQSGWKGNQGTAIRVKFWEFFEELVQNMVSRDWLEWYFLESGNKRIAGYLTIPFGRSAVILKTGYDEEYSSLSPGNILTEKMIEYIFSCGKYDIINFLTDYEWLLRWNVKRNQYYQIVFAFNNPFSFFSIRLYCIICIVFPQVRRIKSFLYRIIRIIRRK